MPEPAPSGRHRSLLARVSVAGILAVGILATGLAFVSQPKAPEQATPRPRLSTPVLSVRRIPGLVGRELADRRLRSRLDGALSDPAFGTAASSSCVSVASGGRSIHEARASLALVPASNLKLLTASALLSRFGPDHRFVTEFRAKAVPVDGVIDGELWIVGGGDPVLMTSDYAASQRYQPQLLNPVDALAEALTDAGIREVRGNFVGDDSRYDQVRYLPTWKPSYRALGEVGPVGALVVDDGFAATGRGWAPAPDPAGHAAALVAGAAERRGLIVAGSTSGTAPGGLVTVARADSPALGEIVSALLRVSDNNTAEMAVKELAARSGTPGTTAGGLEQVRSELAKLGLDLADETLADGSGLDRGSRVSCETLGELLDRAGSTGPIGSGLAVAGRTGTLADRFIGTPAEGRLRAKTGALSGVISLSGWIDPDVGDSLRFAMIVNGLPGESAGRILQERVGVALASYPEAPPTATLGPR